MRQKAYSYEEYLFLTKQTIEAEERGELISRTILDEWGNLSEQLLYLMCKKKPDSLEHGSKPYHGKGYNKLAKDSFLANFSTS